MRTVLVLLGESHWQIIPPNKGSNLFNELTLLVVGDLETPKRERDRVIHTGVRNLEMSAAMVFDAEAVKVVDEFFLCLARHREFCNRGVGWI